MSGKPLNDDASWMEMAAKADPLHIEISFLLRDSFPTDTSARHPKDWPTSVLDLPLFARREQLAARSQEVVGHVDELAAYYRAAQMKMNAAGASTETLFWLRLTIDGPKPGMNIGFAWWDKLSEMRSLFDWIEQAQDGQTFDDLEQGWRVQASRRGERLYFRHSVLEDDEEIGKLWAPASACVAAEQACWTRTETIVQQLARELGHDHWR